VLALPLALQLLWVSVSQNYYNHCYN